MRKLCVPSALSYQPSNAGVMLAPKSLGGFCGMGVDVCALTSAPAAANAEATNNRCTCFEFIGDPLSVAPFGAALSWLLGGLRLLMLRHPFLELRVGQVHHIHPRMRHLVHGPIAVA